MVEAGVVVVGGGPGGLAAARAYREAGGDWPVRLLTAERRAPYFRPHLSKDYLRGELDAGGLPLVDEGWYRDHDVELVLGATVHAVDPVGRTVTADGLGTLPYRACVLATGSAPARLPIPGGDDRDLLLLRSVEDSDALAAVDSSAAVVGSGFIGCEAAASLRRRGVDVTLVTMESLPQQQRLGADAGGQLAGWLREEGVDLRLDRRLEAFARTGQGWRVELEGGEAVEADAVLCAVGAAPRLELAHGAGLHLAGGGIATDGALRTSGAGVWAVGDIAYAENAAAGRPLRVEHWGEAENMGAVAGRALAGEDAVWDVAPGFWSQIGDRALKYVAWGDGHDEAHFTGGDRAWTVWYGRDGVAVGVLTHEHDEDYERGRKLIETGAPLP